MRSNRIGATNRLALILPGLIECGLIKSLHSHAGRTVGISPDQRIGA